jgi:hypothetical protein
VNTISNHEPAPDNDELSADNATESGHDLAAVLIALMKGVLYQDKQLPLWQQLHSLRNKVIDYFAVIGLELYVDDAEGYAFLRQKEWPTDEEALPKLVQSRPLGFGLSVLCLLLRKWLQEHDASGGELRCIINRQRILDELTLFLPAEANEARQIDACNRMINRAIELHLLQQLKNEPDQFEIRRITKALIDAEWLGDLDKRLQEYQQHADS